MKGDEHTGDLEAHRRAWRHRGQDRPPFAVEPQAGPGRERSADEGREFRRAAVRRCSVGQHDVVGKQAHIVVVSGAQIQKPVADAYPYASENMVRNMMQRRAEQRIGAFIDKRPPAWKGD